MHRALTTLGLIVLCLGLFPTSAHADLWWLLDKGSGTKYHGYWVEYRVACFKDPDLEDKGVAVTGFGVVSSACKFRKDERRVGSINLTFAWGEDAYESENKIVMLGPSFSWRAVRSVELGAGGGVAWFSSERDYDSFAKLYLEPVRARWWPLLVCPCGGDNPWLHAVFIEYGMLTFPQGFHRDAFGTSPLYGDRRFGAEIQHRVGFYIDLEPLIRKAQKTW